MTNYEYYKEALEEIWLSGKNTAVDKDGLVVGCGPFRDAILECKNCVFNVPGKPCADIRKQWYKQEHTVELKVDLSNLSEYAKSRRVVIEIIDETPFIIGVRTSLVLRVHMLSKPSLYIEIGLDNQFATADKIIKAVDTLYELFPQKKEGTHYDEL